MCKFLYYIQYVFPIWRAFDDGDTTPLHICTVDKHFKMWLSPTVVHHYPISFPWLQLSNRRISVTKKQRRQQACPCKGLRSWGQRDIGRRTDTRQLDSKYVVLHSQENWLSAGRIWHSPVIQATWEARTVGWLDKEELLPPDRSNYMAS